MAAAPSMSSNFTPGTHRPQRAELPPPTALRGARLNHLTGNIGTVVEGFDLSRATAADVAAIKRLVAERGVLHFTNQEAFGNREQVDFCRMMGKAYTHKSVKADDEFPEVMRIHVDSNSEFVFGAEAWHADITYEQVPAQWTMLKVTECPEVGGDTAFVSTQGLLDKFSPLIRNVLRSLSAVHESYHVFKGAYGQAHRKPEEGKGSYQAAVEAPEYPEAVHPVVIRHPLTGKESLYVNRSFTTKILGIPAAESTYLLQLIHHVTSNATEYQCRIRWTPNSVTLWDNYVVQHTANFDYPGQTRTGYRITTLADGPPQPAMASAGAKL
ncbi:hypothetical protein DFJ74DRAFT_665289 [Hyaloraphidium curvatum]|nr:hypothetical protein DFJ74DRAFT_665289 [Hyaloraphidium curvatum]